jgi:hypothetical protein
MSKVKNVSGGPLDVPVLGRVVEDGETVEVPDFQPDGTSPIIWPANRWEPAAEPKAKAAKPEGM